MFQTLIDISHFPAKFRQGDQAERIRRETPSMPANSLLSRVTEKSGQGF